MFGVDSSEFIVVALVALLVIGPKDLPRVLREVGRWVARGRAMTRHVRAGFDEMMRAAELEEMQKVWAAQNEAIMKASAVPDLGEAAAQASEAHAANPALTDDWMAPLPSDAPAAMMTGPHPAPDALPPPVAAPPAEPPAAAPPQAA